MHPGGRNNSDKSPEKHITGIMGRHHHPADSDQYRHEKKEQCIAPEEQAECRKKGKGTVGMT